MNNKKIIIATWNVGQDSAHKEITIDSYEHIKNVIKENNMDIIAFQEAITESNTLKPLAQYISENTNLKYYEQISLSPSDVNENDNMGVAICSKFKIDNNEKYILENPNLVYKKSDTVTYWSHEKGFNISKIDELDLVVIEGHCLPFHIFKESPLNYKNIFSKLNNKILEQINSNSKVIVLGDFNYENIYELLPGLKEKMIAVYEYEKTRKDKQFDWILTTSNIEHNNYKILEERFDHKLCIAEVILN